MKPIKLPDFQDLRTQFIYDEETGSLSYRSKVRIYRSPKGEAGWITPGVSTQYRMVNVSYINKKPERVFAHRVAWKLMTAEEPPDVIDHIDGNGLNNEWSNLRDGSDGENSKNKRMSKSNTSGFNGIVYYRNAWVAYVVDNGRKIHLGTFDTPEKAGMVAKNERLKRGYTKRHGEKPNACKVSG